MADEGNLRKMFQKARELIAAARETYPKAGDRAVMIVCETTVKMAIEKESE